MKNEQQSHNLLLKVDSRSTFRNNFLQPLLLDKLIKNLQRKQLPDAYHEGLGTSLHIMGLATIDPHSH